MFNKQFSGMHFNKIYACLVDDLIELEECCTTVNRHGEKSMELINASFQLEDTRNCFATSRKLSLKYLHGEMDFYLSGSPFLKDIVKFSKFWNNVSDDGRSINSNYGKLLLHDRNPHNFTQMEYAFRCLKNNPDSKKAVMVIYRDHHAYVTNDNPCTMYLQFFIRDEKLHLFSKMRSNDIWFGVPYDVPFFVFIQHLMLRMLNEAGIQVEAGVYNHNAGSLHLYERNRDKIKIWADKFSNPELMENQYEMFDQIIQGRIDEWMKRN